MSKIFTFVITYIAIVQFSCLAQLIEDATDVELLPFGNDTSEKGEMVTELENDESEDDAFCEWHQCDNDLREKGGVRGLIDFGFLRKFVRNLHPFPKKILQMRFYLFKRDFPDCGHELDVNNVDSFFRSGLKATHPTRIVIHGWMSQSRGSFNRDVKNAYLKRGDYNIIIADWSANAANVNYFRVVNMIEKLGAQLAHFTHLLNKWQNIQYDDVYLIGHSLGAQIAGAAGKRIKPQQYNTIFALDPAGPKFRRRSIEFRIDPTDAKYVESIQTSANLGFTEPTGNATFYPNYGVIQTNCYYVGCSHIRAYKIFAESITTEKGFWGILCHRQNGKLVCNKEGEKHQQQQQQHQQHQQHQHNHHRHHQHHPQRRHLFEMGGEPSQPKHGVFYVKTASQAPFALGLSMETP